MKEPGRFKKILFCTDFSENADFAFHFAVKQADDSPESELLILHVIHEPDAQFWKTYIYEVDNIDEKAKADIDLKFQTTYLPQIPHGQKYRIKIVIGIEAQSILDCAKSEHADLIVIGRQGRSSLNKLLFGNIAEQITRKALCPVLIIPSVFKEDETPMHLV